MAKPDPRNIGKNIRSIRQLRGMKQDTFAKKMGIAQQNVSKMEKKEKISQKKLEEAAKILGVTVETIRKFNEKTVFNSNIAFEQNSGQTNNVGSVKEIINYFKAELAKKDSLIKELTTTIDLLKRGENPDTKSTADLKSERAKLSALR